MVYWCYKDGNLYSTAPVGNTEKLHTWTTRVHLGSDNKFLVWIAKGDRENIGSAEYTIKLPTATRI
jgi:hypothetical protein